MIPQFGSDGLLPVGVHEATWDEITERFGTTGHRRALLNGALRALRHLRAVGVIDAYLDGSMTTEKERPSDYDLCFVLTQADFAELDPVLRPPLSKMQGGRDAMRRKYLGDVLPTTPTGGLLAFFQQDRGAPKGIIKVDLNSLP